VLQALIVPSIATGIIASRASLPSSGTLPALQNEPFALRPQFDYPCVVTDQQLAAVLHKLRPRLRHQQPKINHVDHALRFWGLDARFADPQCVSGLQMQQLLLDHRCFAAVWGKTTPALLKHEDKGVGVRVQEGGASSSHVDHTLASLAEAGTALDHSVIAPFGETTVHAMLRRSLLQFSLNQPEYEWTIMALALYAPKAQTWCSREGQRISYDRLAQRIMRERLGRGCCYGNHRLYTLTVLLRIDDQQPIFSDQVRMHVNEHLAEATRRLIATQSPTGYWDECWAGYDVRSEPDDLSPLSRRLLATGHALEWWAMAPRHLHPPREVLVRAGQWLASSVGDMNEETIRDNYTFLTHVGRSLALWRGDFPAPLYARLGDKADGDSPQSAHGQPHIKPAGAGEIPGEGP
jgi:hypothetical protein